MASIQDSIDQELRASGFSQKHQEDLDRCGAVAPLLVYQIFPNSFSRLACLGRRLLLRPKHVQPALPVQQEGAACNRQVAMPCLTTGCSSTCRFIISRQESESEDDSEAESGSGSEGDGSEADGQDASSGYSSDAEDGGSSSTGKPSAGSSSLDPAAQAGGGEGAGSAGSGAASDAASDGAGSEEEGDEESGEGGPQVAGAATALGQLSLDEQQRQQQRQVAARLTEQQRKMTRRAALASVSRNVAKAKNKGKRPGADAGMGGGGW